MLPLGTGVVYCPTGHLHDLGYCENNPGFGNLGLSRQKTEIMRIRVRCHWRFRDILGPEKWRLNWRGANRGFEVIPGRNLRDPKPSEEKIKRALIGNLRRCKTSPQHPKAGLASANVLKKG